MLIPGHLRAYITTDKETLALCQLVGCNFNDGQLPDLVALIKQNPSIEIVDLARNPDISKDGAAYLAAQCPGIEFTNIDALKTIEQLMEESQNTHKIVGLPFSKLRPISESYPSDDEHLESSDINRTIPVK